MFAFQNLIAEFHDEFWVYSLEKKLSRLSEKAKVQ